MNPINIGYLELRYSGTGAQGEEGTRGSLGGAMSATLVGSQVLSSASPLAGTTVTFASNHNVSAGPVHLKYDSVAGTLSAAIGAGAYGTTAPVQTGSAKYQLATPEGGAVHVVADSASLPVGGGIADYTVANVVNGMFDNISKNESFNGMQDYRCFYVTNTHPSQSLYGVKVFISSLPTGGDAVSLGICTDFEEPTNIGDGLTTGVSATIASETTPPTNVSFIAALTPSTALMLARTLAPGQAVPFWVRRAIPSGTVIGSLEDVCSFTIMAGM